MSATLQQALEALYGQERRRDKLGLAGTRQLLASLGDPHAEFAAVHVAGTNGKGSTCALIERVLRAAGIRTGLYTSPHLVDFRERIRVVGQWADGERLERRLRMIEKMPAGKDRTFFEVATALAFDDFASREVEWAVVETGLGGRHDCTNILESALAVLTPLGLDHTETLGDTLERIAAEKAGIIKPETPVVSGIEGPAEEVVERMADELDAPLVRARDRVKAKLVASGPDGLRFDAVVEPWGRLELETPLRGRHQIDNARIALAALSELAESGVEIPEDAILEGLAEVRWPGRLERCSDEPRVWWDGAHNAEGVAALLKAWREDLHFDPPAAILLGLSRDKDADAIVRRIHEGLPGVKLVATHSRSDRAMPADTIVEAARAAGLDASAADGVEAALERVLAPVGADGRVLLTGSLFVVGEAMEVLGGAPGEWM
jgi:dihydrofolate synthase/folylpolyglutamate synthase